MKMRGESVWRDTERIAFIKKIGDKPDPLVFIEQNKVNFNFSLFYNFIKKVYNKEKIWKKLIIYIII